MGTIELLNSNTALLRAETIVYGMAANELLARQIADEISRMWTASQGKIMIGDQLYTLIVLAEGKYEAELKPEQVLQNNHPRKNFFRIEAFVNGNISFVDAINCNTGFFKLENLYLGSTTAAHEFGHTIGLTHPTQLDLRGRGVPGIMYPRGTIVDPQYQYDPNIAPGLPGGTMHPKFRMVWKEEVAMLTINPKFHLQNEYVIGDFSNIWHESHDMFA